ncbi:MAG: YkgJ family cysteine cluster protein [Myxococcota bacterium]
MSDAGRERLRVHLRIIDDDVAPVVERYREHIECARGCSDCCQQSFEVSALEGAYLREGLQHVDTEVREDIIERARAYSSGTRTPCPVLSETGACRLYEHRPRICRKYGIPLWHPDRPDRVDTCPKNFRNVHDIDAGLIVDPQARWAEDWIAVRANHPDATRTASIAAHLLEALSADA